MDIKRPAVRFRPGSIPLLDSRAARLIEFLPVFD